MELYNMKTAVQWLKEKWYSDERITDETFEQAKEIEKQQMRSASCPYIGGWEDDEFEYWYNEKYKK